MPGTGQDALASAGLFLAMALEKELHLNGHQDHEAQENRDERMSRAESKAASLPAKLTVPMIVFFLPVLFVVILGPAILRIMEIMSG